MPSLQEDAAKRTARLLDELTGNRDELGDGAGTKHGDENARRNDEQDEEYRDASPEKGLVDACERMVSDQRSRTARLRDRKVYDLLFRWIGMPGFEPGISGSPFGDAQPLGQRLSAFLCAWVAQHQWAAALRLCPQPKRGDVGRSEQLAQGLA
jgi:hypothetical protein